MNDEKEKMTTTKSDSDKIIAWKCKHCGFTRRGATLPEDFECPMCGHPREAFKPVYE